MVFKVEYEYDGSEIFPTKWRWSLYVVEDEKKDFVTCGFKPSRKAAARAAKRRAKKEKKARALKQEPAEVFTI